MFPLRWITSSSRSSGTKIEPLLQLPLFSFQFSLLASGLLKPKAVWNMLIPPSYPFNFALQKYSTWQLSLKYCKFVSLFSVYHYFRSFSSSPLLIDSSFLICLQFDFWAVKIAKLSLIFITIFNKFSHVFPFPQTNQLLNAFVHDNFASFATLFLVMMFFWLI